MSSLPDDRKFADVICQHRTDGKIIPIKIRILDEDGEYQTFAVKSYKDNTSYGGYVMPNGVTASNHIWLFECKITVFGHETPVGLLYNALDNRWTITVK